MKESIKSHSVDHITSLAKGALGTIPIMGPLLAEVAGFVIPNQRIDRISRFAKALENRLADLEDFVQSQLSDERFTDLLEEGLRQSARAVSEERIEYIANTISNSLSSGDIEYSEAKHILRILAEISDIEIIWLRFYLYPSMESDLDFRARHKNILQPIAMTMGSPPEERDKAALQESYKEHLSQLGLLQKRYKIDSKTKSVVYNKSTGIPEVSRHEITSLGRLILRQIGYETW